jgi:hypothetical protein
VTQIHSQKNPKNVRCKNSINIEHFLAFYSIFFIVNFSTTRQKGKRQLKSEKKRKNLKRKARLMECDGIKEDEVRTEWRILRKLKRYHNKGTE